MAQLPKMRCSPTLWARAALHLGGGRGLQRCNAKCGQAEDWAGGYHIVSGPQRSAGGLKDGGGGLTSVWRGGGLFMDNV